MQLTPDLLGIPGLPFSDEQKLPQSVIGNKFLRFTKITASNSAFLPHEEATKLLVMCVGGGGGGGSGSAGVYAGGGGYGGDIVWDVITGPLAASYVATIGTGGAGGSNNVLGSGSAGGATSFGSITAPGGALGDTRVLFTTTTANRGSNGERCLTSGGIGSATGVGGAAPANSGAGGGGGYYGTPLQTGGSGGSGVIYVWEFA